jgi:hypothetical protein
MSAYGRSFSMYTEKSSHEIGAKASAAQAGQYTMEPGVLAYYEVLVFVCFLSIIMFLNLMIIEDMRSFKWR